MQGIVPRCCDPYETQSLRHPHRHTVVCALSALGLGCVKTRCRAKPIEWILHQIAIDVGEILKRGRF